MERIVESSIPISRIVLASSSPRRKELVASLDLSLPVYILSTDTDECIEPEWSPETAVEQLSLRKARAARDLLPETDDAGALIVAADTIVVLDGDILGKPSDDAEAEAMLSRLQGRRHEVYTGIACIALSNGAETVDHRQTAVWMKSLEPDRIRRYVATGEPSDKAGSYGIQGLGATLVERIEGCYFNVVGLPLSLLSDMLAQHEIQVI